MPRTHTGGRLGSLGVLLAALSAGCASPAKCPSSAAAGPAAQSELVVSFGEQGELLLDSQSVDSAALRSRLEAASRDHQNVVVLIKLPGDEQRMQTLLEELQAAGLATATLRVETTPAPPPPAPVALKPPLEPPPPDPPPPSESPEPPKGSLPEVTVDNVGLHIGGGPNDDASKAPFKLALEAHFDDFRRCYSLVQEPEKGGTFGVDLLIPAAGGKPNVRQPRTGMKGTEFRDCVLGVFRDIKFDKPAKGPTVISYSLRFKLQETPR